MTSPNPFGTLLYLMTVVWAMGLKIMPLSTVIQPWNPDWVLLVMIYWFLALPYRCGVFSAWMIGILTDVLTGRMLGQYALIYAVISYICLKLYKRIRLFPLLQQGAFIFFCLLFAQILAFCIESIHNPSRFEFAFLFPAFSGTLVWPFVGVILRIIRVRNRVG
jgi:rod shape-determining protein MreD